MCQLKKSGLGAAKWLLLGDGGAGSVEKRGLKNDRKVPRRPCLDPLR